MTRLERVELDDILAEYLGDRFTFRVCAHNPPAIETTLEYLNTLYDRLTPRRKDPLTVARARGARYEWHQHVDIARDTGVTTDETGEALFA